MFTFDKNRLPKNNFLLIFKLYIYNSRDKIINIHNILTNISKVIKLVENIAGTNEKKIKAYDKWLIINNKF